MEYMIVHRAGEIYKLGFKYEDDEQYYVIAKTGPFIAIDGWSASKAIDWLDRHSYSHYWERDND